jgi:transglutaminase-like putative cysteine protease
MKAHLYNLTHSTTWHYQSPVTISHHILRISPRSLPRQLLTDHRIECDPAPTGTSKRKDYFGNDVVFMTFEGAHRSLSISSLARVAVMPAFIPEPHETPPWESVRTLCRTDQSIPVLEANEFTFASPLVPILPEFAEYAQQSFTSGRSLLEAASDLTARIYTEFQFDPTATTVSTPVLQVFENRRGVCQDFAHFEVGCLRALGLPARYVSGYLETIPPPGQPKLTGADASHAWVSLFCPGIGWIDFDPTNNCLPSMRHITTAWGRDYSDVSPIRGILVGSGEHTLRVAVDLEPLGSIQIPAPSE